jgi:hypothetical protein
MHLHVWNWLVLDLSTCTLSSANQTGSHQAAIAMRPLPDAHLAEPHHGVCALLYNSIFLAAMASFSMAQLLKPITNWCGSLVFPVCSSVWAS